MPNPPPAPSRVSVAERNAIIEANQGLLHQIARGFRGRGLDLGDLVGWGQFGLLRAAELFDPSLGMRFSTYATYWIRQAIIKAIENTASLVRIPRGAIKPTRELYLEAAQLHVAPGELLAEKVARGEIKPLRAARIAAAGRIRGAYLTPLEGKRDGDDELDGGWAGFQPDTMPQTFEDAEQIELIRTAIRELPEPLRAVLALRFGLDEGNRNGMRIGRVAFVLRCHWRHAVRLEHQAIQVLRRRLNVDDEPEQERESA